MLEGWKTLIGAFIALFAQICLMYGINFDLVGVTNSVVTLAGLGITIWGRMVANTPGMFASK